MTTLTESIEPPDVEPVTGDFRQQVLEGLGRRPKLLPCKFFYDQRGSELFERICRLEEYYLTRTEMGIMRSRAPEMAAMLGRDCLLIEYGSGSSLKTRILLDHLHEPAGYVPIDISCEHLQESAAALATAYPELEVLPVCADYTQPFQLPLPRRRVSGKSVYFPGSTIGNFHPPQAREFLQRIAAICGDGGGLLIGIDLKKDRRVLERAYNDTQGVTAEFNLNLLRRINCELRGDFRLDRFAHHAFYNAPRGRIEMHLRSLEDQTVHVDGREIAFDRDETIRTECSYKYNLDEFAKMAAEAGFELRKTWTDPQRMFAVQYLTVVT